MLVLELRKVLNQVLVMEEAVEEKMKKILATIQILLKSVKFLNVIILFSNNLMIYLVMLNILLKLPIVAGVQNVLAQ